MDSEMQGFFKNKTVFLTGGTGFLGKVITEKLLRTTEVNRIYSLIRPKRGVPIQDRITTWAKDPVFEVLLRMKPDALQRVCPIAGDCLDPDLGISPSDRRILTTEVQIVIHGAATVRFDEALHLSLAINVRATRLMLQLAKQMTQLVSYVHVSTAYSNCVVHDIEERFYPEHLNCSSDKILAVGELVSNKLLDAMEPSLVGSFPNTYTYTKALAEDVILREAGILPLCIFRPAIIMSAYKEPLVGWVDNLFGPLALCFGGARGIMRVTTVDPTAKISMVPADYCVNVALACAWKTAEKSVQSGKVTTPPIYAFAPSENNLLSYGSFVKSTIMYRDIIPLTKMLWYPFVLCISTTSLFPLAAFFLHTLPGYFFDMLLRLKGRKPILVDLYRKIHKNIAVLGPFSSTTWNFDMTNTKELREAMSKQDRNLYDFDMAQLDWDDYFKAAMYGMRLYIGKEKPTAESIAKGLRLRMRLKVLHYAFASSLVSLAGYVLYSLARLVV
ncbi:fatty acyl-CoA reductase wat [Drosophila sechellia]|uniref:Fatty acyl-CoA reductase n=1 Tax=Drosophila sechellia TaxID=7238 RepID=B4IBS8_DROSE|nr:fatty acyl-CoA reductase wat [Drosophila sechellia]EDW44836.1 GM15173 [Drosophila sechellia]